MKLPAGVEKITLLKRDISGLFPPIGFWEIEEANDGAGDHYGLYWELGKENNEPIICQMRHEENRLTPEFPSLNYFLIAHEKDNWQPTDALGLDDATFFMNLYQKAKVLTKQGNIEDTVQRLEQSVAIFGEYSDSWTLLAAKLRNK
jgi:hypothetical protein